MNNITPQKCHHCGEQTEKYYNGYISLIIPQPIMEEKINKWGRANWWENLEREDLTPEEAKELDEICSYDQALNTVGRGIQCDKCSIEENKLYNTYYPEPENYK